MHAIHQSRWQTLGSAELFNARIRRLQDLYSLCIQSSSSAKGNASPPGPLSSCIPHWTHKPEQSTRSNNMTAVIGRSTTTSSFTESCSQQQICLSPTLRVTASLRTKAEETFTRTSENNIATLAKFTQDRAQFIPKQDPAICSLYGALHELH